uniref:Peptidase aspartic putative domain-containing protein n=1 Tax=Anopheles stephensi TaxID=30069 RepID=A0A182YPA5_ANOST
MNRLQKSLKGDAERSVRPLFLDPKNVSKIITRLEELYGRPKLVYQELLKEVTKIRVDNHKIPELSEAIENLVTNLQVMNKIDYLYDHRLIDELIEKMPKYLQSKWIEYKKSLKNDEIITLLHLSRSSLTLIEQEIANKLNLRGKLEPLTMTWTKNISTREDNSRLVECMIQGKSEKTKYQLKMARTVANLQLPQQTIDKDQLLVKYPHMKDIPIDSYFNARPSILIGLNHSHLLVPHSRVMSKPDEPIAIKTKLGWLVFGSDITQDYSEINHFMVHKHEQLMNDMIKQYFSTEDFGV